MSDWIRVYGAREHNLKNIDVQFPRNKLVVVTGLSGSGKSTLAFDTIFAEGQRRYVESLSAYARQFLGQLSKPDVDRIEGLSPAIAIDQKGGSRNPRSTVGTITEIYDFLRLLFARIGRPHCPICGKALQRQTAQQMVDALLGLPDRTRLLLLAPVVQDRKGEHQKVFDNARRSGFVRVRVDGEVYELDEEITLDKQQNHTIEIVVDRLVIRQHESNKPADHPDRVRISDSVETALKLGKGVILAQIVDGEQLVFSEQYACPEHGPVNLRALEPRDFSFNNPQGACPTCTGMGEVQDFDPDLVIGDKRLSLREGAIAPWSQASRVERRAYDELLASLAEALNFSLETPFAELSPAIQESILHGSGSEVLKLRFLVRGEPVETASPFEGVIPNLRRQLSANDKLQETFSAYMSPRTCPSCQGARLRPEILAVSVDGRNIAQLSALSVSEALEWAESFANGDQLSQRERMIAEPILKEVRARLSFLMDVGLNYLELDRSATSLSGGESQRIRLATQVGSGLSGVLYVLDEPSIGLHPRDNQRLLQTLLRMRDLGNTVLVVEHDEETIRAADWIIDIGPLAGEAGGELLVSGSFEDLLAAPRSITGQFMSGKRSIPVPKQRRSGNGRFLKLRGARGHNLQNVDVDIPLGCLVCVTGVSGSGKSTLVNDTLYASLAQTLYSAKQRPEAYDKLIGIEQIDKVIDIDQSPIGRTPRSNPATYSKVFDPIRQLFANTNEAKARAYDAGRFSFNLKGGRCEHCGGEGYIQVEMQFLPDLFVPCEVCGGTRYNRETLDIRYRGKNIAEVLDMTVSEALEFFERVPNIRDKLEALNDVGLNYLRLGQPATTLSGGEAQRVKLASELARRSTGRTLYILDEPTTGLHFADVEQLLGVLQRLVDAGNSVLVIEHNLDMIKSADWIIDMGPEGGSGGGRVVAAGTPEAVMQVAESFTGQALRQVLA